MFLCVVLNLCSSIFQAVCCYDLRFMDIFVGWPGRSHDSRVFRNNPLFRTLPDRLRKVPEGRLSQSFHIVGDSAFPLSAQVLTPFKRPPHGDLNAVQKKFNKHLSSKRNVTIFCTFQNIHNLTSNIWMTVTACPNVMHSCSIRTVRISSNLCQAVGQGVQTRGGLWRGDCSTMTGVCGQVAAVFKHALPHVSPTLSKE